MLDTQVLLDMNISHPWARQGPQTQAKMDITTIVWLPSHFMVIGQSPKNMRQRKAFSFSEFMKDNKARQTVWVPTFKHIVLFLT